MSRKITVQKTNTLNVWHQKTNTMSGYVGDLDNLDPYFQAPFGFSTPQDSNIVDAVGTIGGGLDKIECYLYEPVLPHDSDKCIIGKITANLGVDSGYIQKLDVQQLWNYDSALVGPRNPDSDYTFYGDSPGTADFDFNADSVHIKRLYVPNADFIDSAQIYKRLTVHEWTMDSGDDTGFNAGKATFNEYVNINTLHMDSQSVHIIRPFYINRNDGVKANAYFGAHLFDSEEGHMALVDPDFTLS
tara:strand:- start:11175 stop:11906 length:732 start_codon:yes stop_codon:yes gene_type:complete